MTTTVFVNGATLTDADWFNDLNRLHYIILNDPTDASAVRTALGLVIGTNVQAYDADLTTWAGITPGANVGAFLATPSSANLIAAVTDETGTGALVFANTPTLVTPVLGTPTSGALTNCTADGTDQVGFKNIPQDAQAGATYTLALTDGGKHVYVTGTCTVTIPTNASVAFPIGATITIINNAAAVTTFTTTSLTVYKAGTSAAWASGGTLSIRGMCTWVKVATDTWFVNGTTLS